MLTSELIMVLGKAAQANATNIPLHLLLLMAAERLTEYQKKEEKNGKI